MTDLEQIFAELGISQYLEVFIEHGFDTWATIQDITESDLDALGVKLGHRRKLQRRIAESRGISPGRALASPPRNAAPDERQADEQLAGPSKAEERDTSSGSGTQGAKRKYRRHPKADPNAPERPASAYVLFSNTMREELKGQAMTFTEIAKLVGEKWQNLSPGDKEPYEQKAMAAKERYNADLAEYKKTSMYSAYAEYLGEFKTRQSNQQQVTDLDVPKRPKLVNNLSSESMASSNSTGSVTDQDTPTAHTPADSPPPSNTAQWIPIDRHLSPTQASSDSPPPNANQWPQIESQRPGAFTLPIMQHRPVHGSPGSPPPGITGYRGSVYVGNTQAIPWREADHEERAMPLQQRRRRVASIGDRPSGYPGPQGDPLNLAEAMQHARRLGPVPHPPSTSASLSSHGTLSSHSSNSSSFLSPRTPLEPLHSLFPATSPGNYENQLPPLRSSPLSPPVRDQGPLHTSGNRRPMDEFPTSMPTPSASSMAMSMGPPMATSIAAMRGHHSTSSPHGTSADTQDPGLRKFGSAEDNNLDPVSALLRAGEIVSLNHRAPPPY